MRNGAFMKNLLNASAGNGSFHGVEKPKRAKAVVAVTIEKKLEKYVNSWNPANEKLIIEMQINGRDVIVRVYAPTKDAVMEKKDEFYEILNKNGERMIDNGNRRAKVWVVHKDMKRRLEATEMEFWCRSCANAGDKNTRANMAIGPKQTQKERKKNSQRSLELASFDVSLEADVEED
ncbi:hypothetical protein ILUMI_01159 [Ignelater luminosus]|uniref:Uncharacterized protein n=1 Tax=Ignelater luminosus TaxID=2038154 RepID=A0A8K0DKM4_IGNLU|nr:hypothetical protein ILUMI_01159 [Ignelater luminosus]